MNSTVQSVDGDEKKRSLYLHSGNSDSIASYITDKVSTIQRSEKGKVQVIILTCSRERAFFLFSQICQRVQNTPLVCHATVGSLRFERDLKALNYGVDILIITPGRIKRLYDRNENCFDRLVSMYVDEAKVLFTRGMINRTRDCCELFKTPELHFFYNSTVTECKVCGFDEVRSQIQKLFSINVIEDVIEDTQDIQAIQENENQQQIHIPSSTYTLLPETDSISIPKRIAYILHQINSLFTDSSIRLVCLHSFSEYNINYLLSFLIEHKDMIVPSTAHLICFSETNIHKEIRSRLSFLQQAVKNDSTYVICLVHDCLLPIFDKYRLFQAQLHVDVPLSEQILQSRLKLLQTENCHFYLTSTQLQVLKMLFAKYKSSLQGIRLPSVEKEKKVVDEYVNKKKANQTTEIPKEELQLEDLSEKEIHSLFYQNEESQIVEPEENQNFIELDLKNMDVDELENLDEELEKLENPVQYQSNHQNSTFQSTQTPMVPQNLLFSVFNPFYNPGVLHCNSNEYSSFSYVCQTFFFVLFTNMLSVIKASLKSFPKSSCAVISSCVNSHGIRCFSETACLKTENEMMGAFQEMQQAETLKNKRVYKEAEQLYNRVNDIVSSFSPANGPMVDVVNRKKLELYYNSGRSADVLKTIDLMKKNVDSRGDKTESIIERMEFANVLQHMGNTTESGKICKELETLCPSITDSLSLQAFFLTTLQHHLQGDEKVYEQLESKKSDISSFSSLWQLRLLNNILAIQWDDDVETDRSTAVCSEISKLVHSMNDKKELAEGTIDEVRQALNTAGGYYLFKEKVEDGGEVLKYALKLSDDRGIAINSNIVSSTTLAKIASILLKQDQPVTCEGLYLQALEVFTNKEKVETLKGFSRQQLFDYSRVCDGYAQLLLKWEKREPLGEKYQQQAVDMMTQLNDGADWMFPLTSHFWTPTLFDWGKSLFIVCLRKQSCH